MKISEETNINIIQTGVLTDQSSPQTTFWDRAPKEIEIALSAGGRLRMELEAMKQALIDVDDIAALAIARDIVGIKGRNTLGN